MKNSLHITGSIFVEGIISIVFCGYIIEQEINFYWNLQKKFTEIQRTGQAVVIAGMPLKTGKKFEMDLNGPNGIEIKLIGIMLIMHNVFGNQHSIICSAKMNLI